MSQKEKTCCFNHGSFFIRQTFACKAQMARGTVGVWRKGVQQMHRDTYRQCINPLWWCCIGFSGIWRDD